MSTVRELINIMQSRSKIEDQKYKAKTLLCNFPIGKCDNCIALHFTLKISKLSKSKRYRNVYLLYYYYGGHPIPNF